MDDSVINLGLPKEFRQLVSLFALRIIVRLRGHRYIMDARGVTEPEVFQCLGIKGLPPETPYRPDLLLVRLRSKLKDLDGKDPKPPVEAALTKNIQWLTNTLALTQVEADIVLFVALAHHATLIRELLDKFQSLRSHEAHTILATVLGHPVDDISQALAHTAKLVRSGLMWANLSDQWGFTRKLGLLEGVADQLMLPHKDPFHLFLSNFRRSTHAALQLQDYTHLNADLQVLVPYLRDSLHSRRKGVNILIFGPPGTGKTELVRTVAQEVGAPLFEIACEDRHGYVLDGKARFGAYQMAQGVLGGDPHPMVLFDEIEDAFHPPDADRSLDVRSPRTSHKARTNLLLEENTIPAFWVCNSTWGMDPAVLRRFDFVLEIKVPPRSVRYRILEQHTAGLSVSPTWVRETAEHEHLTPAAIERAAKVARVVLGTGPGVSVEDVLSRVLGNSMEAMGAPRHPRNAAQTLTAYRLDVLNADRDLAVVLEGLKRAGSARACLHGPPGTGKSAFARHLAEVLDRPLLVKRASDLQSKWVGETEKNLARMFDDATQENAVLLLDEADSFLTDRREAQQSWEVSQVNELLTLMETFEGIFIASTNSLGTLDQAAFRRFDLKILFDYMTPLQCEAMFRDCMASLGLQMDVESLGAVATLSQLTPGDFNVVMRQARLVPIPSARVFAERLTQECQLKPGGVRRSIGFRGDRPCH